MLMVIFGAGASYDSDASNRPYPHREPDPDRLPLANQLFEDRSLFRNTLAIFPACAALVPRLRYLENGKSIEEELERLAMEAQSDVQRARQLASVRFYIQTVIRACEAKWLTKHQGVTNYLTLLDDIRHFGHTDVSLVTFNYEIMLERAAVFVGGQNFSTFDDYLSGRFKIFKVHGSVNWGRVVTGHNTAAGNPVESIAISLIHDIDKLEISNDYRQVNIDERPLVRDAAQAEVLFPAVAIPFQSKLSFECPAAHLEALRTRLSKTDRILIVGWRGQDAHFTALLKEHLEPFVRIQIVCGSGEEGQRVANTLREAGLEDVATFEVLGQTFSEYVLKRAGHDLLRNGS